VIPSKSKSNEECSRYQENIEHFHLSLPVDFEHQERVEHDNPSLPLHAKSRDASLSMNPSGLGCKEERSGYQEVPYMLSVPPDPSGLECISSKYVGSKSIERTSSLSNLADPNLSLIHGGVISKRESMPFNLARVLSDEESLSRLATEWNELHRELSRSINEMSSELKIPLCACLRLSHIKYSQRRSLLAN
jgi:hypothetical protein